jgi:hypothetical protein
MEKRLPGGVSSMIAYSFFNQGSRLPRNRMEYDLEVLRNELCLFSWEGPTPTIAKQHRSE